MARPTPVEHTVISGTTANAHPRGGYRTAPLARAAVASMLACTLAFLPSSAGFAESADSYYAQLKKQTDAKDFKSALDTSLRAMKEYPAQEGFHIYAIWSYRETGDLTAGIEFGKRALSKFPDSKAVRENLSYVYAREAARICDEKLAADPLPVAQEGLRLHRNGTTLLWYGICLRRNGRLEEARDVFTEGKSAYPDIPYYRLNLVHTLVEMAQQEKDPAKSDGLILKAYREDPENEGALIWYGISLRRHKRFDEAIVLFVQGMKRFPGNRYFGENARWAYTEWTSKLTDAGDVDRARKLLEEAGKLLPNDPFIISSLAYTWFRRDQARWEQLCREAVSLVPPERLKALNSYQVPLQSGRIMIHQGNMEPVTHMGIGAGYGFDLVRVDEDNRYGAGWHKKEDHLVFGEQVHAALDGKVVEVYDASPDTEPDKNQPYDVNYIRIEHDGGESSYYMHLKRGSAVVAVGTPVKKGQMIARVGSSGRFADFPHLHFQVMRDNICVEIKFTGAALVSGDAGSSRPGPFTPKKRDIMKSVWK